MNVAFVVLQHRLHPVQRLVDARFQGLPGGHFGIQGAHFRIQRPGQSVYPGKQQRLFPFLVRRGFAEDGNIPGETFAQIMNQAHFDHLVHVRLRKFVADPVGHQRQPPAVVSHAFPAAAGGVAVARGALELFRQMQRGKQRRYFHNRTALRLRCRITAFPRSRRFPPSARRSIRPCSNLRETHAAPAHLRHPVGVAARGHGNAPAHRFRPGAHVPLGIPVLIAAVKHLRRVHQGVIRGELGDIGRFPVGMGVNDVSAGGVHPGAVFLLGNLVDAQDWPKETLRPVQG